MTEMFPTNPQFGYDYGLDLHREKRCKDALRAIESFTAQLDKDPTLWSNQVRAKLYWLSGRCEADLGQKDLAKRNVERAAAQSFEDLEDQIAALKSEL